MRQLGASASLLMDDGSCVGAPPLGPLTLDDGSHGGWLLETRQGQSQVAVLTPAQHLSVLAPPTGWDTAALHISHASDVVADNLAALAIEDRLITCGIDPDGPPGIDVRAREVRIRVPPLRSMNSAPQPGPTGYAVVQAVLQDGELTLRLWPRRAELTADYVRFEADARQPLDADEAITIVTTHAIGGAVLTPRPADAAQNEPPVPGLTLVRRIPTDAPVSWAIWAGSGTKIATGHADGAVLLHDLAGEAPPRELARTTREVTDLAFDAQDDLLALATYAPPIEVVELDFGAEHFEARIQGSTTVAACPVAPLWAVLKDRISLHDQIEGTGIDITAPIGGASLTLAWSKDAAYLAVGTHQGFGVISVPTALDFLHPALNRGAVAGRGLPDLRRALEHHPRHPTPQVLSVPVAGGGAYDVGFDPVRPHVAAALSGRGHRVEVFDLKTGSPVARLEEHTDLICSVAYSPDGRFLVTKSHDGRVIVWRTETWQKLAELPEPAASHLYQGASFSPDGAHLLTLGRRGAEVRIWRIDPDVLLAGARASTLRASAKVVVVGEGGVGKTCLAKRLAAQSFDPAERSTHGMQVFSVPAERLAPPLEGAPPATRDVMLWDLGGQEEYRLLHQLFLRDTALALVLCEPRRDSSVADALIWGRQLANRGPAQTLMPRFLVGTKVDDEHTPDGGQPLVEQAKAHGFIGPFLTSAKSDRGIEALGQALVTSIPWATITVMARTALFQHVHERVERRKASGKVVLAYDELEDEVRAQRPEDYTPIALNTAVELLAQQGRIGDVRMGNGERMLVLDVAVVERYASSILLMARDNLRQMPAVDLGQLYLPNQTFPRLRPEDQLPSAVQAVVLQCIVQLFLESQIAFFHSGMLVFPSLLPPPDTTTVDEGTSIAYDLSGGAEVIYASLVSGLARVGTFGPPRLSPGPRAVMSPLGSQGELGVRLRPADGAGHRWARIELFFTPELQVDLRRHFVAHVEQHLQGNGVEVFEKLEVRCSCGKSFDEATVRARLTSGKPDIGCEICDQRVPLALGGRDAADQDPSLTSKVQAIRVEVRAITRQDLDRAASHPTRTIPTMDTPIRILHLTDLHVRADQDPAALLQPLLQDLTDPTGALRGEALDYLVISGDLTNEASPEEFTRAYDLVARLMDRLQVAPERCVVVPGNHDLSWASPEEQYRFRPRFKVDAATLRPGTFVEEKSGYLIRDDDAYHRRFESYAKHFHARLTLKDYPLTPAAQFEVLTFPEHGLQFLAFNSAHEVDLHFTERSGLHDGAVSAALLRADELTKGGPPPLRLAVWHHPVTGQELMADTAFLERLVKANVRLALHGHVHEDRRDWVSYYAKRNLKVIGAGSLGAAAKERPESMPRLYNLLELQRDLSSVRVWTRAAEKRGGAFDAWPKWEDEANPGAFRSYYDEAL
ncbi:MAG: metallophosphoesterase [Alphaproteobacteria bacterium]|nr:metallophosphoesterase [Alphaproteobacteria bacterium]